MHEKNPNYTLANELILPAVLPTGFDLALP